MRNELLFIIDMQQERVDLRGMKVFPFASFQELLSYVSGKKGILVAINAEKILHATEQTRDIINRNIGYCDGAGAVMALKKKGYEAVKLPGCELWLKIIESTYKEGKTFYLVGGKQEVIDATVEKLRKEFKGINIINYRNGYLKTDEKFWSEMASSPVYHGRAVILNANALYTNPADSLILATYGRSNPRDFESLFESQEVQPTLRLCPFVPFLPIYALFRWGNDRIWS